MTKEELIENITRMVNYGRDPELAISLINEFINSNVCIPKGENRHPFADVIHEWVENTKLRLENKVSSDDSFSNCYPFGTSVKYRIKPSEPVYEWQWKFKNPSSSATWDGYTIYGTDEESKKFMMGWMLYEKDEETKRIRQ